MDEKTHVILSPAMDEQGNIKWVLDTLGVNVQLKQPGRTSWITFKVPTDYVLYVSETGGDNTLTFEQLSTKIRELVTAVESGLIEKTKEEW
jgi:hypothetical protein